MLPLIVAKYKNLELFGWLRRSKSTIVLVLTILAIFNGFASASLRIMIAENVLSSQALLELLSAALAGYLLLSIYIGVLGFGFRASQSELDFVLTSPIKPSSYILGSLLADLFTVSVLVMAGVLPTFAAVTFLSGKSLWLALIAIVPLVLFLLFAQTLSVFLTAIRHKLNLGMKILVLVLFAALVTATAARVTVPILPNAAASNIVIDYFVIGFYSQTISQLDLAINWVSLLLMLSALVLGTFFASKNYPLWSSTPFDGSKLFAKFLSIVSPLKGRLTPLHHRTFVAIMLKEITMILRKPEALSVAMFLPASVLLAGLWVPDTPAVGSRVLIRLNLTGMDYIILVASTIVPVAVAAEWFKSASYDLWLILTSPIKRFYYVGAAGISLFVLLSTMYLLFLVPLWIVGRGVDFLMIVTSLVVLLISTSAGVFLASKLQAADFESLHISPKLAATHFLGYALALTMSSPLIVWLNELISSALKVPTAVQFAVTSVAYGIAVFLIAAIGGSKYLRDLRVTFS